jgi:hypothetical protein
MFPLLLILCICLFTSNNILISFLRFDFFWGCCLSLVLSEWHSVYSQSGHTAAGELHVAGHKLLLAGCWETESLNNFLTYRTPRIRVFWDVTLCHWKSGYRRFDGMQCQYLQQTSMGKLDDNGTTFLRKVCNSRPITKCHIPEDPNPRCSVS